MLFLLFSMFFQQEPSTPATVQVDPDTQLLNEMKKAVEEHRDAPPFTGVIPNNSPSVSGSRIGEAGF